MATTVENEFFRKKHTTSVAYLAALLLFFLPFVQIKCNDLPFAENNGIGLALGRDYKVSSGWKDRLGGVSKSAKVNKESGRMYVLALAAFIAGIVGFIISLSLGPKGATTNIILGILSALALIIVMIQVTADVKQHARDPERSASDIEVVKVTADFTLWYYLSVCCFLAAAFFSYKHKRLYGIKESSPGSAEQETRNTE
jgi:hypothetical protein